MSVLLFVMVIAVPFPCFYCYSTCHRSSFHHFFTVSATSLHFIIHQTFKSSNEGHTVVLFSFTSSVALKFSLISTTVCRLAPLLSLSPGLQPSASPSKTSFHPFIINNKTVFSICIWLYTLKRQTLQFIIIYFADVLSNFRA